MHQSALVSFEFSLTKRCGNWKDFKGEEIREIRCLFSHQTMKKRLNKLSPDCSEVKGGSQSVLQVFAMLVRNNELKRGDITSVLALDHFLMTVKMKNCCSLPKQRTKSLH